MGVEFSETIFVVLGCLFIFIVYFVFLALFTLISNSYRAAGCPLLPLEKFFFVKIYSEGILRGQGIIDPCPLQRGHSEIFP
jgi:hypothetical protein